MEGHTVASPSQEGLLGSSVYVADTAWCLRSRQSHAENCSCHSARSTEHPTNAVQHPSFPNQAMIPPLIPRVTLREAHATPYRLHGHPFQYGMRSSARHAISKWHEENGTYGLDPFRPLVTQPVRTEYLDWAAQERNRLAAHTSSMNVYAEQHTHHWYASLGSAGAVAAFPALW